MKNRGPSFMFNTEEWLMNFDVIGLSLSDQGRLFRKCCEAAVEKDWEFLKKQPFIGRIFKGYNPTSRKPISIYIRKKILSAGHCKLCSSVYRLEIDHIIPVSKGGGNEEENLQVLCFKCNRKKGAKIETLSN